MVFLFVRRGLAALEFRFKSVQLDTVRVARSLTFPLTVEASWSTCLLHPPADLRVRRGGLL